MIRTDANTNPLLSLGYDLFLLHPQPERVALLHRTNTVACLVYEALCARGCRPNPTHIDQQVAAHIESRATFCAWDD